MHVGVNFSVLFVIFSLYFGRKWAETGERVTASTTIFPPPRFVLGSFRESGPKRAAISAFFIVLKALGAGDACAPSWAWH